MLRLFAAILAVFLGLLLLSWPILFSFNLWVFSDRGNMLNVEYLLAHGLRLGVDAFYSYGLLPVALQHLAFRFGQGYRPMIGCTLLAAAGMAFLWAVLLGRLARTPAWLGALLCISPMLLWINPNFPYSLVLLSMLGALALVMHRRFDLALAAAAFGCWSVPSLPVVLVALLVALIVFDWATGTQRSITRLARRLAPGAACYLAIGAVLALMFGWRSVLATALPLQGARFYAARGYGPLSGLHEFLSPAGAGLRWYLFTRSGWWVASSVLLFAMGVSSLIRMLRARLADGPGCVVLICAVLHGVFAFCVGGPPGQHLVYDPILAGGVLLGLGQLPAGRWRGSLLAAFMGLSLLGNSQQARDTWRAWRQQEASPLTLGLYAPADFTSRWSEVLDLSRRHRLLLLAYPTGVHHYFPGVESPLVWFFETGQLLPADEDRVLAQMSRAEIIVQYPAVPDLAANSRMQLQLDGMRLSETNGFFRIWRRRDKVATMP